ncbi:MAG: hypothetical protein M9894_01070 [Planctomycetes bacterium]|nr:hypothetical protein [Planctomycetota bacterium]
MVWALTALLVLAAVAPLIRRGIGKAQGGALMLVAVVATFALFQADQHAAAGERLRTRLRRRPPLAPGRRARPSA